MGREIVSIATALVPYPPARVWAVVTDLDCWQWRSDLSRLDHVGEDAFTEYDRSGFPTRFTVTERRPLSRWAFDLDNANLAGRWAGEFRPEGGGTQVTFTETITVKKPWMRFFAKGNLDPGGGPAGGLHLLGRGGIFCRGTVRRHGRRRGGGGSADAPR